MESEHQRLLGLLLEHSVKFGEFTLRSGNKSDLYIDCRPVILSRVGKGMIARAMGIISPSLDCLAATGVGGTYIACSIANFFYKPIIHIRGEAKSHGMKNLIELPYDFNVDWKILIVDDILTTGNSLETCIIPLLDKGYKIGCCTVLVDRMEGGKEHIENTYKIPVKSLFTKLDFKKPANKTI